METDTGWKYQLSWKLGHNNNEMLNVRADTAEEFDTSLRFIRENVEEILAAANLFSPQPSLPIADARATPPPAPAPKPVETTGTEIGPVTLERLNVNQGTGKTGKPFTRYQAVFSGGIKASTFDTLIAGVAQGLVGKPCYARVHQGNYGYDLDSVRPA